jgi:hypothetical protein
MQMIFQSRLPFQLRTALRQSSPMISNLQFFADFVERHLAAKTNGSLRGPQNCGDFTPSVSAISKQKG